MTNCSFEDGFMIDMEQLEGVITFVNCTYNGELITADNYQRENFITWDAFDAKKVSFNSSVANIENGNVVMTMDGVTLNSVAVKDGTLDGSDYTLTVATVPGDNGIIRPEGTSTIKNLTIDGKNKYYDTDKGMRAIYITKSGTYTIDKVITTNVTYPINVNTTENVVLNVSNSTLEGWTSYGSTTTATFSHVNFTKNTTNNLAYFRPYGTTTLKDCNFAEGFKIDFAELTKNNKTISFENCYYNETRITADNIETLGLADSYDAKVVTFVK